VNTLSLHDALPICFGLRSDELRRLNKLTGDRIRVGQKLNVGSGGPAHGAAAASQDARTAQAAQAAQAAEPAAGTSAAGTAASGTAASGLYEVQPGDTVSVIAERFGLRSDELRRLNKLPGDRIRVGQKLNVGSGRPDQAASAPPQTARAATSAADAGTADAGLYEVQPGDTVSVIAERFGLKSDELRRLNNLAGDRLRVGQKLKVGDGSAQSSAQSSAQAQLQTAPASSASFSSVENDNRYLVDEGDTVNSVAQRFGLSSAQLRRLNGLSAADELRPGQRLHIHAALDD
jgi:LysM repeat protein